MSLRKNIVVKSFTASLVLLLMMALMVNAQTEVEKQVKEFVAKNPNGIVVYAKIINLDAIKGDITFRLEFYPQESLLKEDLTLAKTIKFDTESANGKAEVTFEKGKRMSASEVVLTMYGERNETLNWVSKVEDYPLDSHRADLYLQFYTKPDKKKETPKEAPKDAGTEEQPAPPKAEEEEEETEEDVPHFVVFTDEKIGVPTASGYDITVTKNKENSENFTSVTLNITRSMMVKIFVSFILVLMWAVSLAVFGVIFTVVILKRKAEIAMFSFIATLIFAFVTVRNALPGSPPVGTLSDKLSFFWAEGILGMCLLAVILTWIFRKPS